MGQNASISTLYKDQKTLKTLGSSKITISNYTHMISHCTLSKKSVVAVLSHFFEVRPHLKVGVFYGLPYEIGPIFRPKLRPVVEKCRL